MPRIVNRCYCGYCGKAFEGNDALDNAYACEAAHESFMPQYSDFKPMRDMMKDTDEENPKFFYKDISTALKFKNGIALPTAIYIVTKDYNGNPRMVVYRNSSPMNIAEGKVTDENDD